MVLNIILLLVGLALILGGANYLTDGASAIAKRWGVSDLVIGLTVVAFGTSAPELAISVIAAINDSPELAVGNVVGSNIFNILVILGVTAMVKPVKVEKNLLTRDILFVLLSALVLLTMGNGPILDGDQSTILSRTDGIVLLLFFAIFMRYTFTQVNMPQADVEDIPSTPLPEMPIWKALIFVIGGLGALVWGGDMFVDKASAIAGALGVSDAVIGLTIVAAGTSLPELATSIVAAKKGRPGMAIGNVIGSNIFNTFFVLGAAATVRPLPFDGIGNFDLIFMTVASILFWLFATFYRERTITRVEGALLLVTYLIYTGYLISIA